MKVVIGVSLNSIIHLLKDSMKLFVILKVQFLRFAPPIKQSCLELGLRKMGEVALTDLFFTSVGRLLILR